MVGATGPSRMSMEAGSASSNTRGFPRRLVINQAAADSVLIGQVLGSAGVAEQMHANHKSRAGASDDPAHDLEGEPHSLGEAASPLIGSPVGAR